MKMIEFQKLTIRCASGMPYPDEGGKFCHSANSGRVILKEWQKQR